MSKSAKKRGPLTENGARPLWRLHEGDCIEGLASMSDGSVDVVLSDPPYEAEAHTSQRLVARAGGKLEVEPLAFRRSPKSCGRQPHVRWPDSHDAGFWFSARSKPP